MNIKHVKKWQIVENVVLQFCPVFSVCPKVIEVDTGSHDEDQFVTLDECASDNEGSPLMIVSSEIDSVSPTEHDFLVTTDIFVVYYILFDFFNATEVLFYIICSCDALHYG